MISIYGKKKTDKKYQILGDGALQGNLIYGEFYPDEEINNLTEYCTTLELMNPEYTFEVRPYKGNW